MKLNEAYNLFQSLIFETSKKSEKLVYQEFIEILSNLENRDLLESEIQYIETGLGNLNLKSNPENRKKYFKKTLKEFKEYLKEKYSLVSAGHYTGLYISLGASFGIVVGIIIGERTDKSLGIALGISIGMLIPNYALVKTRTCNIFIMNKLYELC